ncbi:MAG: Crp/Fnr family transcriptional regulator [Acetivibrio ethanolgignens]
MKNFLAATLPFWDALTEEEKELSLSNIETKAFPKGTVLYHVGMREASFKIVRSGIIRGFISTPDGNEVTLYRLMGGDMCVLSVVCIMNVNSLDIHMEAETDSEVSMLPAWVYQRLNEDNNAVKDFTQQILTERFQAAMQVVSDLAFNTVGKRLAKGLLQKMRLLDSKELFITHETMAKDIGSAREVVSRTLKHFENLGIVKLSRGKITILDIEELEKQ